MLKNKFIIIFGVFIALLFVIDINEVFANTNASTRNLSNATSCTGGYCWSTDAGMRLTVVDEAGNRCKWDTTNKKIICNSTVSADDKNGKSIDYWWNNKMGQHATCFSMKTKYTKKEFLSNKSVSNVGSCSTTGYYLNNLFNTTSYANIKTQNEPNAWKKLNGTEGYKNPSNIQSIINYLECNVRSKNATLFGTNTPINDSVCGGIAKDENYTILNNIMQNAFNDSSFDVKTYNLLSSDNKKIYVQFEQLIGFNFNDGNAAGVQKTYTLQGTIAEVVYMHSNYYNKSISSNNKNYRYGFAQTCGTRDCEYNGGNIIDKGVMSDNGSVAICTGIFDGWTAKSSVGVGLTVTSNSAPSCTNHGFNKINDRYLSSNTRNVFSFWIDDSIGGSCNKSARIIQSNSFNNDYELKISEQEYYKTLYDNQYTKGCITKNGDTYKLNNSCSALSPLNIKSFKGITVTDACSDIACNNQLDSIITNYSKYSELIDNLYDYWKTRGNNYILLVRKMWEDLYELNSPSCGTKEKDCEAKIGAIGNCSITNNSEGTFFSDSIDSSCWKENVAYNDVDNKSDYTLYQTTKDSTFSTEGCKVYCRESVSFNLPNENGSYGTKAGRIFKWGINKETNNKEFGTMTVTRTCQVVNPTNNNGLCSNNSFKPFYWTTGTNSRINTELELKYKEPVSDIDISNATIKSVFKNAKLKINNTEVLSTDTNNSNPENTSFRCNNGNCKSFEVSANYSFEYPNELYWFSDKTDNYKLKTMDELTNNSTNENDVLNSKKYIEIGYGLPTMFTSSTTNYKTYKEGYEWINESTDEGYMYVNIKNIGTKNSDGTYHFDKLIKMKSKNNIGFNDDSTLTYGCDYSIKNILFGYECLDKDGNILDEDYCDSKKSPTGLDVVFRSIDLISNTEDLDKSFPGRIGNGRESGNNWNKLDASELLKILNPNVYDNDPMYHIKLTPSLIQNIRSINKKTDNPYNNLKGISSSYIGRREDGYAGYYYNNDGSIYSIFLQYLKDENRLDSICIKGSSITDHESKCNQ